MFIIINNAHLCQVKEIIRETNKTRLVQLEGIREPLTLRRNGKGGVFQNSHKVQTRCYGRKPTYF